MKRLKYFKPEEFEAPEELKFYLLDFIDVVRAMAGIPFLVTSDYRSRERNTEVGGSKTSWHMTGEAIDFVPRWWDAHALWLITRAVVLASANFHTLEIEYEIVQSKRDKHIHIGVRPKEAAQDSSRLILALD